MDHIVLNVEDDEKMMSFYSQILVLTPERLEEYRAGEVPSTPLLRSTISWAMRLMTRRMSSAVISWRSLGKKKPLVR